MRPKPITLSVFFPAYNEAENIREAVEEARRVCAQSPYVSEFEIIVVNDGSRDATLRIAQELAKRYREVHVVDHGTNRGYGAALKSGIAAATKEYIFFTDADLQFDITELQNLLIHLERYSVVIGYRAPRRDPFMRLLNARGWNTLNRLLFGLRIRDIDCAFKVFRRELIQKLPLRSGGAMLSAEILIRLSREGITIKEVPVSHLPRRAGSPTGAKPSVILRAFSEMMRLYWNELGFVTNKEVLKFMSVGVINTLLDLLAYVLLTRTTTLFAEHLVAAKFFSFLLGTISSLLLNRTWTFGVNTGLRMGEVIRFYTVTSVSIVLNVVAMNFLVSMGLYDLVALVCTTLITFGFNFILSKFWIFRRAEATEFAQQV
jgi:glycosyltransferase involved in cell wall biosynthesis